MFCKGRKVIFCLSVQGKEIPGSHAAWRSVFSSRELWEGLFGRSPRKIALKSGSVLSYGSGDKKVAVKKVGPLGKGEGVGWSVSEKQVREGQRV